MRNAECKMQNAKWKKGSRSSFSILHFAFCIRHFVFRLRPKAALLALAVMLLALAPSAFACPVCWGNPDDPMVKGANNGVWVLLGVIAFVQIGFAAMFWSFWRKARELRRFRESLRVIEGGPHR
jgi:hypothetical protein